MVTYQQVKQAMLNAASAETAYGEYEPTASKLDGHCGAVAHVVQSIFGGELVGEKIDGERHIWNRLPSGKEIDLSSCQYGGEGFEPLKPGRLLPKRSSVNKKHALFELRTKEILKREV